MFVPCWFSKPAVGQCRLQFCKFCWCLFTIKVRTESPVWFSTMYDRVNFANTRLLALSQPTEITAVMRLFSPALCIGLHSGVLFSLHCNTPKRQTLNLSALPSLTSDQNLLICRRWGTCPRAWTSATLSTGGTSRAIMRSELEVTASTVRRQGARRRHPTGGTAQPSCVPW